MAGKNIHVVPHFHWDREWYFTAEESKILLVSDMEEVLDMLEANQGYPCFVLDGQTSILEDYFGVKPENQGRVKALVEQGRLIIGPWYTQTDEMVVGGESIVRNLLYGKLDCKALGPRMDIGYLPDSFGQSARMPQILNGFGIRRCIFWRGTSERMGTDKTEFYWEGDDGAMVAVQLLPLGYAIGKYLPQDLEKLRERMDKYLPVLDHGATADTVLLPNGHDQMPIQKDIFDIMGLLRKLYPGRSVSIGRYEDVFEKIESQGGLASMRGEFLDGKYMRVHRSIYSSRADLKAANTRIENKVTNLLEPLMSMAWTFGFPYEHGLVEAIWKELLKNHAHDSMGCCCSDKVHRQIADRFHLAEDRADCLIESYQRRIVDAMDCRISLDKLTAFNLLPYRREEAIIGEVTTKMRRFYMESQDGRRIPFEVLEQEVVDPGLIDRQIVHYGDYEPFVRYRVAFCDAIPPMGYRTYFLKEEEGGRLATAKPESAGVMENRYYQISIARNGTLHVLDKRTGAVYEDVLVLEDGGDDGDGYDYSPPADDWALTSAQAKADVSIRRFGHLSEASIRFTMQVPRCLESRRSRHADSSLQVEWKVLLREGSPIIELRVEIDNQAKDHRLRVLIPGGTGAGHSISDNQFGLIRRPVTDPAMEVWEEERWSERPDSIYPFLSCVRLDAREGMAVLTNSVREYEAVGDSHDTIAITLFRCVGVLGKEELLRRPGRPSGIKMPTPDSQMQGRQAFDLAITSMAQDAPRLAKEYTTPILTYNKMPYHAMKLNPSAIATPYEHSLLEVMGQGAVLSALKKAEEEEALLLRFYHPAEGEARLQIAGANGRWEERRLDETGTGQAVDAGQVILKENQIRTLAFLPDKSD